MPVAQPVARGEAVFCRHAQHEEGRVHEEDEGSAGTQEPDRFWNPARRVLPQAGAVLGDHQVEARIRIGYLLRVAVDQRKREAVLTLQPAGRGQLGVGAGQLWDGHGEDTGKTDRATGHVCIPDGTS
jgi:hypothetical protein